MSLRTVGLAQVLLILAAVIALGAFVAAIEISGPTSTATSTAPARTVDLRRPPGQANCDRYGWKLCWRGTCHGSGGSCS